MHERVHNRFPHCNQWIVGYVRAIDVANKCPDSHMIPHEFNG